ncbi:MAG TPA: hypothetical protein VKV04_20930 [Verrucomicrobiae bacterium]|nr:hypothetical protein [Verrucomicrobiae bacterium]
MKTKLFLVAALFGVATLSANAGVRFGFAFGLPVFVPPPVVVAPAAVVAPAPVVVPAPVVAAAPVVYAPPVVYAAPVSYPAAYIWTPGHWGWRGGCRVWVGRGWYRCR